MLGPKVRRRGARRVAARKGVSASEAAARGGAFPGEPRPPTAGHPGRITLPRLSRSGDH